MFTVLHSSSCVLIVAKCIVNLLWFSKKVLIVSVLIVAKCIVNYLYYFSTDLILFVLIVANCIVNVKMAIDLEEAQAY